MKITKISFIFPLSIALSLSLISLMLGQDTNGDVWNYHWYNAWAFLNDRLNYDIAPAGAHSYLNPYLDTIYYYSITHLRAKAHALLFGFIQGLVAFPIFYIVRKHVSEILPSTILTILCTFGSTFFIGELGQSMQDNSAALLILTSLAFIYRSVENDDIKSLSFAALIIGVATGLKLTSSTYLISFGVISLIFIKKNLKDKLFVILIYTIFSLTGMLASTGHWFYGLYESFGNPIFPFYNNIFKSSFASLDANATRHMFFFQQKGIENLFYPFFFAEHTDKISSAANAGRFVLYTPLIIFIISPIALLLRINEIGIKKIVTDKFFFLFILFFASYFIWQKAFGVYRYFIPNDLLNPLIIYLSLGVIFKSLPSKPSRYLYLAMTLTTIMVGLNFSKGIPTWGRGEMTNPYFSGNIPNDLKSSDVLFTFSNPSGWILPIIQPKGHVVGLGDMLFNYGTDKYWMIYQNFTNNIEQPKQYAIFDEAQHIDYELANKKLDRFGLKLDRPNCRNFNVKMSSFIGKQLYCPVIRK